MLNFIPMKKRDSVPGAISHIMAHCIEGERLYSEQKLIGIIFSLYYHKDYMPVDIDAMGGLCLIYIIIWSFE